MWTILAVVILPDNSVSSLWITIVNMSIVVHETSGAILLLTAYKPGDKFGALQIDLSTDKVLSFQEKPEDDRNWINAGYFVCEPEVFGYIPENDDMAIFERTPLDV